MSKASAFEMEQTYWQQVACSLANEELHQFWGLKTVQLEVTNSCDCRCLMCDRWSWKSDGAPENEIELEVIKDILSEAVFLKARRVLISGGEPFLRPDINSVFEACLVRNLKPCVFTSGLSLEDCHVEYLVQSNTDVCFSLDGSNNDTYEKVRGVKDGFDRVISTIGKLCNKKAKSPESAKSRQGKVGLNFVVQRRNLNDVTNFLDFVEALPIDYVRLGLVHGSTTCAIASKDLRRLTEAITQVERRQTNYKLYLSSLLKSLCSLIVAADQGVFFLPAKRLFRQQPVTCFKSYCYTLVNCFGDVYPCSASYFDNERYLHYEKVRRHYTMGNVLKNSLTKIWNGERYQQFRKEMSPVDIEQHLKVCGQCESHAAFVEIQKAINGELANKLARLVLYEVDFEGPFDH